jgi:hypothetical protein
MANAMAHAIGAQSVAAPGRQVVSMSMRWRIPPLMGDQITLRQMKLPVRS